MADAVGSLVVRIGGDASDLLDTFRKAGKATQDFNSTVHGAVTGVKALASALAIREMAGFIDSIVTAEDALGKMAEKVGITVEALSALKYSAGLSNISFDQLGTGLQQLARHMQDAQAGVLLSEQAFKALGIQVDNGVGQPLRSTQEVLLQVADKFARMEDGAGKTALAMRLFGRAGAELIPLLNQGSEGLRKNADEARALGITLSDDAAKQASEFRDNLYKVEQTTLALARDLSGPLVKALAEAGGAFVQARKDGESFFSSLIEGWRTFITGTDQYKFDKQIVAATNNLLDAQAALDRARNLAVERGFSKEETDRFVAEYIAAVKKAQAEVDRLRAIKPIIAPEEEPKKKGTEKAPALQGTGAAAEAERTAKALQEGVDEEEKTQSEALAATVAYRDAQLAKQKEYVDSTNKTMMDAYDAEQAAAIAQGEALQKDDDLGHAERLKQLRASNDAEYAENERYRLALQDLSTTFSDAELKELGGRHALEEKMQADHESRVYQIRARLLQQQSALVKTSWAGQTAAVLDQVTAMTSGVSQQSRALFELNKIASIANIAVKTPSAIASAYEFGVKFGGPPLGAAMAAIAGAAMLAQAAAAGAAQFGGGSSTAPSVAGTTPAPAVTPVPAQQTQAPSQSTVIHLHGDTIGRKQLRDLMDQLNENSRDGGRFVLA